MEIPICRITGVIGSHYGSCRFQDTFYIFRLVANDRPYIEICAYDFTHTHEVPHAME